MSLWRHKKNKEDARETRHTSSRYQFSSADLVSDDTWTRFSRNDFRPKNKQQDKQDQHIHRIIEAIQREYGQSNEDDFSASSILQSSLANNQYYEPKRYFLDDTSTFTSVFSRSARSRSVGESSVEDSFISYDDDTSVLSDYDDSESEDMTSFYHDRRYSIRRPSRYSLIELVCNGCTPTKSLQKRYGLEREQSFERTFVTKR